MKWTKKGLIFEANGFAPWAKSHAMIPTPDLISEGVLRLYLTFCDDKGIGRVGYVDVSSQNPSHILNISTQPVLDIGRPGTFDENGVLQTSLVTLPNGDKLLYYAGFELGTQIRYRLLTGVAISYDQGETFNRIRQTPILERSDQELFFRGGPFVLLEKDVFKMWYVAGSQWMMIDNKSMPVYSIHYLESPDGITWGPRGKSCITIQHDNEHGFGRPFVYKDKNLYKMFYSIRVKHLGYRLGYAESKDGIDWIRKDKDLNLFVSSEGWDSETVCYSAFVKVKEKTYLFYNGNAFGKTGFGYAELANEEAQHVY